MLVYRWKEKSYRDGEDAADFIDLAKKLYVKILEYEANLLVHKDHNPPRRWARDVFKAGDWTARMTEIQNLDAKCSKLTEVVADHRAQEWRHEERQWQADLLRQPRKEQEKRNIQKLYINYEAVKNDYNRTRVPGTCEWFLRHPDFLAWRQSRHSSLLWLSADPGCGKSVLSKYLVDRKGDVLTLSAKPPVVCYFFFKDGEADCVDASKALCAILHQLFLQRPSLYKYAEKDFESKGDKFLDDFNALWNILIGAAMDESNNEIICVLDAVDECRQGSRKAVISKIASYYRHINEAVGTHGLKTPVLKFLVTSRPYTQIGREFKQLTTMLPTIKLSSEDQSASISKEIDLYVEAKVKELGDKLDLSYSMQQALRNRLLKSSERTYLWLRLVFDLIESMIDISEESIKEIVDTMPDSLNRVYTSLLDRISDKPKARKLLNIVLAATRPLTLAEINITMAIQDKHRSKIQIEKNLWSPSSCSSIVKNLCGLLVTVVDTKVYLIHKTVRDFLLPAETEQSTKQSDSSGEWKGSFRIQISHDVLMRACISYLLLDDFALAPFVDTRFDPKYIQGYELLNYASEYWATHFTMAKTTESVLIETVAFKLCNTRNLSFSTWYHVYQSLQRSPYPPPLQGTSLMVLSWFGFDVALKLLTDADSSAKDQNGRTALLLAAQRGHITVVESLLLEGVDINAQDQAGRTSLSLAVEQGLEDMVTALLKNRAEVNAHDIVGLTPLAYAAKSGHKFIVEQLLGSNADIDLQDDWRRTAGYYGLDHAPVTTLLRQVRSSTVKNEPLSGQVAKMKTQEPPHLLVRSDDSALIQSSAEISTASAPKILSLVASIEEYFHERFQSKAWISQSDGDLCVNARTPAASTGLGSLYDNMKFACDSYERGSTLEAGGHLFNSFSSIETAVQTHSPNLLSHSIRVIAYLMNKNHLRIARAVCGQFSTAATTIFPSNHPLPSILVRLPLLMRDKNDTDAIEVLKGILNAFQDELGAMHMHTIYTRHIMMEVNDMLHGPQDSEHELLDLLVMCDSKLGPNSAQSIQILVHLAQNQFNRGLVAEAENNGQRAVERASRFLSRSRSGKVYHMLCEGHRLSGEAQTVQGKEEAAELNLKEAFQIARKVWRENNSTTLKYRQGLVDWLLVYNRAEDAAQL